MILSCSSYSLFHSLALKSSCCPLNMRVSFLTLSTMTCLFYTSFAAVGRASCPTQTRLPLEGKSILIGRNRGEDWLAVGGGGPGAVAVTFVLLPGLRAAPAPGPQQQRGLGSGVRVRVHVPVCLCACVLVYLCDHLPMCLCACVSVCLWSLHRCLFTSQQPPCPTTGPSESAF